MKHYNIDCWEVTTPDGGGMIQEHVAFFSSRAVAEEYAMVRQIKSKWPTSLHSFTKSYTVLDSIDELAELAQVNLRKSALKKLTKKEREALGLQHFGVEE